MADDVNEEIIGGIGVTISGDYSSLQASYSTAQSQAEAAGEAIAEAFNDGVSSVSDAADVVTEALGGIGPAADDAGDGLDGYSNSVEAAGNASEEAGGSLASLAEQMAAVGEALVITEGLKELGTEALGAADSIAKASIALTTITGSGDTAKETIQGLEQLGMQDGLAMPSLLTAAQRMTALLPAGTNVVALLGQVADGATAMGTDIESAAQRFNMIVNAGTLSARALTSLGLSLTSVTAAMNQVNPSADATTQTVTAMFKAMDPGDRIQVLQDALTSLGGTAQQVAEQTFGGQWQQLANAWEDIMVQAGQAILPVISDLLEFVKTDVAPFLQSLVEGFNELPGPIKDTAVAIGLVVAAMIPITGMAAAAAIGLNGLAEAVELLGLNSAEAATEQGAEAIASAAQGEAAAAAAPEVAGLGEAAAASGGSFGLMEAAGIGLTALIGVTLVSGLAAAAFGFTDLQASIKSAQSAYADAGNTQANFDAAMKQEIADLATAELSQTDAANATKVFQQALDLGEISAQQFATAIKNIATAQANFATDTLSAAAAASGWNLGLTVVHDSAVKATDQQTLLNQVLADAQAKFQQAAAGYQTGATTAQQYISAQNAVTTAQTAVNAALGPVPGSMDAIDAAATKLATSTGFVVSAQQEQANETAVATSSLDLATNAYNTSVAKVDLLKAALDDVTASYNAGVAPRSAVIEAEGNLQKAYADSQKAETALQGVTSDYAAMMATQLAAAQKDELAGLQATAAAIGPVASQFTGLDAIITALQNTMPNFGVITTNIATGPLAGLQSALAEATGKAAQFQAQMQAGQNVGAQYEKALTAQLNAEIALNQYSAEMATGLQGQSDAFSLAAIAVAAAQAKYDTLNQAFQTNIQLAPQVESAQKALTAAQNALNAAVGATSPLLQAANAGEQGLGQTIPTVTATITQQATQLQTLAQSLQSVGAAVQSVESDFNSALGQGGAWSGSGGQISAPAGYTASIEFLPGNTPGGAQEIVTWVPDAATILTDQQAWAKQLYDAGYTPAAIAKSTTVGLSTILSWLSLPASAAYETESQAGGTTGATSQPLATAASATGATDIGVLSGGAGPTLPGTTTTASTETLAQATQALQVADAALNTAERMGNAAQIATAQATVAAANAAYLTAGGFAGATTATASTATASTTTVPVTTSGTAGTSAIDGGSYPAVTAHQAAGEIWAVSASGETSGADSTASSVISTNVSTVVQQAVGGSGGSDSSLTSATQAVGGAVQQLATTQGPMATSAEITANAAAAIATAIGGLVVKLNAGTAATTVSGGGGTGYTTGPATYTSPAEGPNIAGSGASQIPVSTPPNALPPGYNPFAGTNSTPASPVNASVTINVTGASNPSQVATQVASTLVTQLRAAGARF